MKKGYKVIALSFLVLLFSLVEVETYADDPRQNLYKGTDLLRQNDVDGAVTNLSSAITLLLAITNRNAEQNKQLAEALNNRGLAYMEKAKEQSQYYEQAENDFKAAQTYNPEDTKPGNNLGLLYYEQERYNDARIEYEAALAKIPEGAGFEPFHADIFSNLGVCYAKMNPPDYAKAIESYTKAIEIANTSSDADLSVQGVKFTMAYYNRGNLYYNLTQYDKAIADYTTAIEFFEKAEDTKSEAFGLAYYNRGLCYYNQGKYQEAINDYTRAIELKPGFMWSYYAKGFAYYMLGQDSLAEAAYRNVIAPGEIELNTEEKAHVKFGYGLVYVRKKAAGQNDFDIGMGYLKEACNSGKCDIACQALKQGLFADPGTILVFELPR